MAEVIIVQTVQILHISQLCACKVGPAVLLDSLFGRGDHCGAKIASHDLDIRVAALSSLAYELAQNDICDDARAAGIIEYNATFLGRCITEHA